MPDPILAYEFSPDKVSVSLAGDNAIDSLIDLHVKITPRGTSAMVGGITINIPVSADGKTGENRLSANPRLPDPVYDQSAMAGWTIEVDQTYGSIVHISPVPKTKPKELTGTIEFTLQDILVNHAVGIVPITVDEFAPSHVTATFQIDKEDADRPVKKFYVADENGQELNPAVIYDLDQQVKLKWECTKEGQSNYSFGLRTTVGETWQPKDCLARRDCFSCQDGIDGVLSDNLGETTTFALDVIKTDGERRRLESTLYTTVKVEMPNILSKIVKGQYFKGRCVELRWKALNAARCEIQINDVSVDANAPIDTYKEGYFLPISSGQGTYTLSLTAYAHHGSATAADTFTPVTVGSLRAISTPVQLQSLAITPDGKWAVGTDHQALILIDVNSGTARELPAAWQLPVFPAIKGIAITPDGTLAVLLVVIGPFQFSSMRVPGYQRYVAIMEIPAGQFRGAPISVVDPYEDIFEQGTGSIGGITVTPDGRFALATNPIESIAAVNIAAHALEKDMRIHSFTTSVSVTPNGRYALGGLSVSGVSVLDLSTSSIDSWNPIHIDPSTTSAIAITAESGRALVVGSDLANSMNYRTVSVVDIHSRQQQSTIVSPGSGPNWIALTTPVAAVPELAVVVNRDGNVMVLRVDDLNAKPIAFTLDQGIEGGAIAISKTGGANNHGVGLIATNQGNVIKFDVDELPWRAPPAHS